MFLYSLIFFYDFFIYINWW